LGNLEKKLGLLHLATFQRARLRLAGDAFAHGIQLIEQGLQGLLRGNASGRCREDGPSGADRTA
jgi:hypothetical protein